MQARHDNPRGHTTMSEKRANARKPKRIVRMPATKFAQLQKRKRTRTASRSKGRQPKGV